MLKIKLDNFEIYTNEIIHPIEFENLCKREEILSSFTININKNSHASMATFLAKERRTTDVKPKEFVIFRAVKGNMKFEFISKITSWGRFCVPKIVIDTLKISDKERVNFEIVKTKKEINSESNKNLIDLMNHSKGISAILRENNLITLVKNGTTSVTLPRHIKLTSDLIELFYLIHGDGHYNTKLFFVSKDADLIRFVMDKFEEILRIPKETWRARLLYNNPASPDLAKGRWQTSLKLKDEQFYPSVSKCVLNTSENGNLRIVIDKLIVAYAFRSIFDVIKENARGKNALHALNGLLCAEGSAEKSKRGLHKITINFSSKEKEMFLNILSEAGLSDFIKDRRDRFVIEGWTNCYQFFKVFFSNDTIPFNLHSSRCKNALSGFLEHSFTRSMDKYLSILNKKETMNTNELMAETCHLGNSVRRILRKKQYLPFVHAEGRGVNRAPIKFSITSDGREFLNIIKSIREANNEKCRLG